MRCKRSLVITAQQWNLLPESAEGPQGEQDQPVSIPMVHDQRTASSIMSPLSGQLVQRGGSLITKP